MKRKDLFERVNALKNAQTTASAALPDDVALNCVVIFPAWENGSTYTTGNRVQYGGKLYKCVQAHTAQADWAPDSVPALWTEVAKPGEIPVWKQPTGAQDAYFKGDRVHYPGEADQIYESTVDNNVWAPDVYGWQAV